MNCSTQRCPGNKRSRPCTSGNNSILGLDVVFSVLALMLIAFPTCCHAFSMTMLSTEYKPPVKSSVRKFYDRRLSSGSVGGDSSPGSFSTGDSHKTSSGRTQSSKAAVAGAAYAQHPSPASFQQRMREALFGGAAAANGLSQQQQQQQFGVRRHEATMTTQTMAASAAPPNLHVVESLQDYKHVVGDETSKLVVVRFHATYCRACKAVTPAFYKMVWTHPQVVFVDVPVTEKNVALHQGLRVPSLPFAHIYHPTAGLVVEQRFTRQNVVQLEETLHHYMQGSCPLPQEDGDAVDDSPENSGWL